MHSRQKVMYARGRKEKRECFREAMSWEICKRIWEREERRNRAKRMRDARMDRAMARLDRMSKVEECVKDLLRICPELGRGELEYLFDTKIVHETRFRQHKGDGVASRKQVHRIVGESRTNRRMSRKWLTQSE